MRIRGSLVTTAWRRSSENLLVTTRNSRRKLVGWLVSSYVAASVLNKQFWTPEKGRSSSLVVGGLITHSIKQRVFRGTGPRT
jgi:hypothetical protein